MRSRLTKLKVWEYPRLLAQERAQREAAEALAADERTRRIEAEELFQRSRTALRDDEVQGGVEKRPLLEQMGNMLSLLTLIGLLIYAVAMLGYRSFYDTFNISPEEAGLTYAPVLTQAAIGVSFIASGVFISLILNTPGSFWLRSITVEGVLNLLLLLTVAIVMSLFWGFEGRRFWVGILIVVVVSVLFFLLIGAWQAREPGPGALSFAAILLVITLFICPSIAGSLLADDVRAGRAASTSPFALLKVEAREVRVSWMNCKPTRLSPAPGEYVYLGQSGGVLVIYDSSNRVVYRVPSQTIIVSESSSR